MKLTPSPESMLREKIIPFWEELRDEKRGGWYGRVDARTLETEKDAVKGCILNSRILWFFSECFLCFQEPQLLEDARHGYLFLRDKALDKEYGGVYWSMTADGLPSDDTKHTYNQAFAIYGLSAYYRASKDPEALQLAYDLYHVIESRCRDENGYLEAFDRQFRPVSNEKLSENGVMATRTMNTLLHVFEGYSGLYEADHNPEVADRLKWILNLWLEKMYNPALSRQEVFFDGEYHTLIDLHSYGHDIETSWLLDWGASLLEDEDLKKRVSLANSDLAQKILHTAWHEDSLWTECERGVPLKKRVWWVQAETVQGFLHEYRKHPEEKEMLEAAKATYEYIHRVFLDGRTGEWFNEVAPNGTPDWSMDLVNLWKCPYHNGRMYLRLMQDAEEHKEENQ